MRFLIIISLAFLFIGDGNGLHYEKSAAKLSSSPEPKVTNTSTYLRQIKTETGGGQETGNLHQLNNTAGFVSFEPADSQYHRDILRFSAAGLSSLVLTFVFIFIFVHYIRKKKAGLKALENEKQEIIKVQNQLKAQENLALLGRVAAGIVHEIRISLNFINNFAASSSALTNELSKKLDEQPIALNGDSLSEIREILDGLKSNSFAIEKNGQRVDRIVRHILQHASDAKGKIQLLDLHALIDDHVKLAFYSHRFIDPFFNLNIEKDYDHSLGPVEAIPQDLGRAILIIVNNACSALTQKLRDPSVNFTPTLIISTRKLAGNFEINLLDNGPGIPEELHDKIFNPFFTTQPVESGNIGLGLSICNDIIVNGHGGTLRVESELGEFTRFTIRMACRGFSNRLMDDLLTGS